MLERSGFRKQYNFYYTRCTVGRWKDEEMAKDEAWERVAKAKGLACKVCGAVNPDRGKTWLDDLCPEHIILNRPDHDD